jgi:hypothetical protein
VGDFDTSVGHIHVDLIQSCCYYHGYMTQVDYDRNGGDDPDIRLEGLKGS